MHWPPRSRDYHSYHYIKHYHSLLRPPQSPNPQSVTLLLYFIQRVDWSSNLIHNCWFQRIIMHHDNVTRYYLSSLISIPIILLYESNPFICQHCILFLHLTVSIPITKARKNKPQYESEGNPLRSTLDRDGRENTRVLKVIDRNDILAGSDRKLINPVVPKFSTDDRTAIELGHHRFLFVFL